MTVVQIQLFTMSLWEIWEWDGFESWDSMMYGGENLTFDQLSEAVRKEITRIHLEVEEDTLPYEQFSFNDDSAGNVIYSLPLNEKDAPDSFKLARMTNGILTFGLTAWRKGKNPYYEEDF